MQASASNLLRSLSASPDSSINHSNEKSYSQRSRNLSKIPNKSESSIKSPSRATSFKPIPNADGGNFKPVPQFDSGNHSPVSSNPIIQSKKNSNHLVTPDKPLEKKPADLINKGSTFQPKIKPQKHPKPAICKPKSQKSPMISKELTSDSTKFEILYHMTNREAGEKINETKKMIPGIKGKFGPAVYFSEDPYACVYKSVTGIDCLVTSRVRFIGVLEIEESEPSLTKKMVNDLGNNAVKGLFKVPEYAVYDPEDVEVLRVDCISEILEREGNLKSLKEIHHKILVQNYPDDSSEIRLKEKAFDYIENLNPDIFNNISKIQKILKPLKSLIQTKQRRNFIDLEDGLNITNEVGIELAALKTNIDTISMVYSSITIDIAQSLQKTGDPLKFNECEMLNKDVFYNQKDYHLQKTLRDACLANSLLFANPLEYILTELILSIANDEDLNWNADTIEKILNLFYAFYPNSGFDFDDVLNLIILIVLSTNENSKKNQTESEKYKNNIASPIFVPLAKESILMYVSSIISKGADQMGTICLPFAAFSKTFTDQNVHVQKDSIGAVTISNRFGGIESFVIEFSSDKEKKSAS